MNGHGPHFTVAIPTYNGARHIEEAVRSILDQDGVDFDLILSDDRSTDDTLDRVRSVAGDRARVEVNSERLGLAGNWNRCVALARSPLVNIFHQDDVMRPGHLAAHLAAFGPGTALVASAADVIDADGLPVPTSEIEPGGLGPGPRRFPPGTFLPELAVANPLRCSAVSLRAEVHAALGGFRPDYRFVVDWDFWIRVAEGHEVAWIGQPTVSFRWHTSSETHAFKAGTTDLEETARLLDSLRSCHPDLANYCPAADRRLARAYLNRAYEGARAGQPALCRRCLCRAVRLHPGMLGVVLGDPRLAARLLAGSVGWGGSKGG
jgi:glycosyltransferase involved in cell wall biosynthesis